MTREDLLKLNKQIMEYNEEERKEHDLYLRKLATGEYQGPPVGYSSIDKPWLKFYNEEKYTTEFPKELFYEGLVNHNKENLDRTAINYFYTKISFKKFFENVDSLIQSLNHYGVKDGDAVGVCLASIPESMYAVGALSYLGALGIFFPPYLDKKSMISDINKDKCKVLLIMDMFYDKNKAVFDELIENSLIEKIVVVPTLNSSILRIFQKKKELPNSKFVYYDDFIREGAYEKKPKMAEYSFNKPLAVVYSSGTTGILKGVWLSNDTFVNSAESYTSFGFDLTPGQKVYQVIPVWTSTGLIADGTTALYYGCTLYQNPTFDPEVYSKNLGIHRINWGIATTELFSGLIKLSEKNTFNILTKLGILDYKKLTNAYIGGTVSTKNDREKINEILKKLGSTAKIRSSYGTCENGSIVTAELNGHDYCENSVGTPIPSVNIMCVDENLNEVPIGERGEIAVSTKCGMIDYYNRPDLPNIFFSDGKSTFKKTGDVGRITTDGVLVYEGRLNDFSMIGDTKVYNFDVKNEILKYDNIYDCEVLTNDDGVFCAHIIFKNTNIDLDEELAKIQRLLYERFQSKIYIPEYFKIRQSFPMAGSTKRDYKKLKSESSSELKYVEFRKTKILIKK